MLPFTGERFIPAESGEIRLEHYHRYVLARTVAQGKVVLDLACGEGYGSALLSTVTREVVGVDLAADAVAHAKTTYGHLPNLSFECNSATQTGLPDAKFDMVVSFETIEHLAEQTEMMAEIRRVLKPDGLLLISSPNRPVYSDGRSTANEFHVKELDFEEFDELLRRHFSNVEYYGQRLAMGTVVQPLTGHCSEFKAFSDDGHVVRAHTGKLTEPVYFVALCSPLQGDLPLLGASVFFPDSLDLVKHYTGFAEWAKKQDIEINIRNKNVEYYKSEVEKLSHQREQLRTEIHRAEAQLELLKDMFQNQLGDESL